MERCRSPSTHGTQGFSVVDVRDPRVPEAVGYLSCPDGTWSLHLQSADGLLLVAR